MDAVAVAPAKGRASISRSLSGDLSAALRRLRGSSAGPNCYCAVTQPRYGCYSGQSTCAAHCGRDRGRREPHEASFRVRVRGATPASFAPRRNRWAGDPAAPRRPRNTPFRKQAQETGEGRWEPVPLRARPVPRCGSGAGDCRQPHHHSPRAAARASRIAPLGLPAGRVVPLAPGGGWPPISCPSCRRRPPGAGRGRG
jgi:hypothetical protein